jgi:serine/threonine-protein kinase
MPKPMPDDPSSAATLHQSPRVEGAGDPTILAETKIAGRYVLLGFVGAGGMGTVYKARDTELDDIVALKVLRRDLVNAPGMLERFRREVKLSRRVTHKNVARMFDIGEHEGERFLTMELVEGESLACVIERRGAMSIEDAIGFALPIAEGLSAAHAAGVIHRDLKPENVLVAPGRVVITDFGIARAITAPGSVTSTSQMMIGTPAYMAPEQVRTGDGDIDARADIYAFGCVLFELLTGKHAFWGDLPLAVAAARLIEPPPDPRKHRPDLPTRLAEITLHCLAVKREDRYATIDEVARDLSALTLSSSIAEGATTSGTTASGTIPIALVAPGRAKTVAVLPFRNAGAEEDEFVAEELTDDLIDALSITSGLKVTSRGIVQRYRGQRFDPREVGRELGVQVVVEGSVRRASGQLRISARLVSVADGFQLWAKRFDRPERDILIINDEAAAAIAHALTADSPRPDARELPTDPIAIDLYLRARHEYRKFWVGPIERSVDLFGQALQRAPDDPMLLAGYALARSRLSFYRGTGVDEAHAAAIRAVRLAPNLADPHLALGSVLVQMGDITGALQSFRAAIHRNPSCAEAHASIGRVLAECGDLTNAQRYLTAAIEIDPLVPLAWGQLARTAALTGDWQKADEYAAQAQAAEGEIGAITLRSRFMLWRGAPMTEKELSASDVLALQSAVGLPRALFKLLSDRTTLPQEDPEYRTLVELAGSQRRRSFFSQLAAECAGYINRPEAGLQSVREGLDYGLLDLAWLDHCPVLAPIRALPDYPEVRARLAARAQAILDAFKQGS